MYTIRFVPEAMAGFRKIPSGVVGHVSSTIQQLRRNPRPPDAQHMGSNFYRIAAHGHIVEYEVLEREAIIKIAYVL